MPRGTGSGWVQKKMIDRKVLDSANFNCAQNEVAGSLHRMAPIVICYSPTFLTDL